MLLGQSLWPEHTLLRSDVSLAIHWYVYFNDMATPSPPMNISHETKSCLLLSWIDYLSNLLTFQRQSFLTGTQLNVQLMIVSKSQFLVCDMIITNKKSLFLICDMNKINSKSLFLLCDMIRTHCQGTTNLNDITQVPRMKPMVDTCLLCMWKLICAFNSIGIVSLWPSSITFRQNFSSCQGS